MKKFISILIIAAISISTAIGVTVAVTNKAEQTCDTIVETAYKIYSTEPQTAKRVVEQTAVNLVFADDTNQEIAHTDLT